MSVLVTDAHGNHALAVVRSLGRHGIPVVAADSMPWAKSFFSRFCARRVVYPSPEVGAAAFVQALCRILDTVRPALLMPMTERTLLAITAARNQIESRVTLAPLPSERALAVAFDKRATMQLAESCGIATPQTFWPAHPEGLGRIAAELPYPVVIKPRRSEIWTTDDRIVPGGPVEYSRDSTELETKYLAVHRRAPLPLIQEFIPGEGYGISMLYCRGQMKALFAHRRLRMIRPTGSGSSLRESIMPPPDMVDAARSLLDALAWHGVAMVEFKRDARDGLPKLMEINGRFWNSLPLAIAAGVEFPLLLHRLATEGDIPECFEYVVGVRARWIFGDLRHLIAVLRGRPQGWTDTFPTRWQTLRELASLGRNVHYDELWPADPWPIVGDFADFFLHQLPQHFVRPSRQPVEEKVRPEFAASWP